MKQAVAENPQQQETTALEKIRPELNLEKWSIWQPAFSKNQPKKKTFQREIVAGDGSKIAAKVEVGFTDRGALTTEDQKTYYALVKQWEDNDRSEEYVYFSLRKLAKTLKKRWGTNVIHSLTESLMRLRFTPFTWENSYYDSATKEAHELLDTFNIISDLKIVRRKKDGVVNREVGYFRFNDYTLRNLLTNHTKPLLLDVVLNFKSEVAQILYIHLDLVMNDKTRYERRTKELFDDLGLQGTAYSKNSKRNQILRKALQELQGVQLTSGVLATATLEKTKDGKNYKVAFRKRRTNGVKVLPVAEAESRGVDAFLADLPPTVASVVADDATQQAQSLVKHFHKLLSGVEKNNPSSKEIGQATALVARHGEEKTRSIVEYAIIRAKESGFKMVTFGAVLQYEHLGSEKYDQWQQKREQTHRREVEQLEQLRLEEAYGEHCQELLDSHISAHYSEEKFQELVTAKKQELLRERRSLYSRWNDEIFNPFATRLVRADIGAKFLPTFEQFCDEQSRGEAQEQTAIADQPALELEQEPQPFRIQVD